MKHLAGYVDNITSVLLFVVAGLTPLFFLNQTTEFYDMPKLVFLIVSTIVLLGLWIFSWILKGKIVITRTPLDIPLIFLLIVVLASTYFSTTRFASIYGNFPTVHGSAVAWVTYILLYFVAVSNLKRIAQVKTFLYVVYGSGILVALITLLSFFGLYMPLDFAKAVNFTPTGSSFSTVAFLALLIPLPMLSIINSNKFMPLPLAMALTLLFGLTVVLIGQIPTFIVLALTFALCFFISKPAQLKKTMPLFALPLVIIGFVMVLAYAPLTLPMPLNKLQQMESSFPKEIQLPFDISWKVSASAMRDATFLGTGPATYLFNFTSYKPAEFNLLRFWNFSFDTANNEFLQVLGTLGLLGLTGLILFGVVVFVSSWRNISLESAAAHEDNVSVVLPGLAVSGLVSIMLLAAHATTLVSIVMSLFMLAALMMAQKSIREKVTEVSMGLKAATSDNKQFDLLPVIVFAIFLLAGGAALYQTYNATMADYWHRQGLLQANKSGTLTYQYLQKAEAMNPYIDLYRVDMAQTNFALANAIAAKAVNAAPNTNPLTDQDKQTIQTLLSQSINEGRVAVALSPRSARNWEVLASIYRNITGISQNALAFALDGYGRAIQRDPLNPALRVSVGGIYYSVKNYDLAIRFFSDAANLKPDYANAYYNLSLALRDKGDLQNARLVAEQTVILFQKNTSAPDYKVAVELLNDLKSKEAKAKEAQTTQSNSALANPELQNQNVNVSNLNNPPQPQTPAAVKKNPDANIPALTPTPAQSAATTPTPAAR